MTKMDKRLITFISWSGIVVGLISMVGYLLVGLWIDSIYGALATFFFTFILYRISLQRISYDLASILFSSFGILLVTLGYITSASVADGLIYMIIPTIIIALLRPFKEAIVWLVVYYSVFFMINFFELANFNVPVHVVVQLISIHLIMFLIISYYSTQERELTSELRELNTQLQEEATIDVLTGAYNRRAFRTILNRSMQSFLGKQQRFVLALIDIDYFKQVNDNYGHQKGDEVLQTIGQHLKNSIRESDTLIRYGGEEFVICFEDMSLAKASKVMNNIRQSVADLDLLNDNCVTISVGLSEVHTGDTSTSVLSRADKALYAAKAAGRNRVMLEEDI